MADLESFIDELPDSYLVEVDATLPRPAVIRLKEKALEEGWTVNQALTVLINRGIDEI
ncbi:MAG: hypothetical protein ABEJ83_02770 [Candidatus Nanohaloarchaea archaeon]